VIPTEILKLDEILDVWMVHPQHGHIGAPACTSLGDLAKGLVINPQEAHRPRGLAGRGRYQIPFGPKAGEGEAIAATSLLNQSGVPQGLKDA